MNDTATKTYHVTVIERALAFYEVAAENPRDAAENWSDGDYEGRDDEALDTEGPSSVREQQPDGTWRKVPPSEWQDEPPADTVAVERAVLLEILKGLRLAEHYLADDLDEDDAMEMHVFTTILAAKATGESALLPAGETAPPGPGKKPYSVLLLYPEDVNDSGTETYYAFVEAPDAIEAVAVARREAVAAQEKAAENYEPDDFAPLLVTEGHHRDEALFNK